MDEASVASRDAREALRASLRTERRNLSHAAVREASRAVCRRVAQHSAFATSRRAALYAAIAGEGEIDVSALADLLWARGADVVFPRVVTSTPPRLDLHHTSSFDALSVARYGVREPDAASTSVAPESVDLFVVPGVAFDRSGHRLGFGKGFYDELLARAGRALRVGVCHEFQLVDSFPHRDDDAPVDVVVTPAETFTVLGPRNERGESSDS